MYIPIVTHDGTAMSLLHGDYTANLAPMESF